MTKINDHEKISLKQVEGINLPPSGSEPSFLDNPVVDQLLETIVTLGGELWTERDHRYRLQALLEKKGLIDKNDLSDIELDEKAQASRDAELAAYVKRLYDPLKSKPFSPDQD